MNKLFSLSCCRYHHFSLQIRCGRWAKAHTLRRWSTAGSVFNLFGISTSYIVSYHLLLLFSMREAYEFEIRDPRLEIRDLRSEIRDSRSEIRDPRSETRDSRSKIWDPRSETRDSRFEMRDPRLEIRDPRSEIRDSRSEIPDSGSLVFANRIVTAALVPGQVLPPCKVERCSGRSWQWRIVVLVLAANTAVQDLHLLTSRCIAWSIWVYFHTRSKRPNNTNRNQTLRPGGCPLSLKMIPRSPRRVMSSACSWTWSNDFAEV